MINCILEENTGLYYVWNSNRPPAVRIRYTLLKHEKAFMHNAATHGNARKVFSGRLYLHKPYDGRKIGGLNGNQNLSNV